MSSAVISLWNRLFNGASISYPSWRIWAKVDSKSFSFSSRLLLLGLIQYRYRTTVSTRTILETATDIISIGSCKNW